MRVPSELAYTQHISGGYVIKMTPLLPPAVWPVWLSPRVLHSFLSVIEEKV